MALNFSSNTFTCSFLNQLDTTAKFCSILYGFNPQQLTYAANGSNDSIVTLPLHDDVRNAKQVYFIVTASNNTFTILVEGNQNQNFGKRIKLVLCINYAISMVIVMINYNHCSHIPIRIYTEAFRSD